jgi:hypothetical protein
VILLYSIAIWPQLGRPLTSRDHQDNRLEWPC